MTKPFMPILLLILVVWSGCSQDQTSGVYVEIFLQNDKNINSYVVYNRDVKTIEECESSFAKSLPIIMEQLPPPIPINSKATGWKCSLEDPAKGR